MSPGVEQKGRLPPTSIFPIDKTAVEEAFSALVDADSKTRARNLDEETALFELSQKDFLESVFRKAETLAELSEQQDSESTFSMLDFWRGFYEGCLVAHRAVRTTAKAKNIVTHFIPSGAIARLFENKGLFRGTEELDEVEQGIRQFAGEEPGFGKRLLLLLINEPDDPRAIGLVQGIYTFVQALKTQEPLAISPMLRR